MKKITMSEKRNNEMYCDAFQLYGNDKLLDFYDEAAGIWYKYAQFNTIPGVCCPFASVGCAIACYAKGGLHKMPTVKASREKSYKASLDVRFAEKMVYTIEVELTSRRYNGNVMLIRVHESGDFYSLEYLKKWVKIFSAFQDGRVNFCFYTKSFKYFLELTEAEKNVIRAGQAAGTIAFSLSLDDTTTKEQIALAMEVKKQFPLANIYYCTDNVDAVKHDNVCDCADCARCGNCTHATGKTTVVKIHTVTTAQLKKYQQKKRNEAA